MRYAMLINTSLALHEFHFATLFQLNEAFKGSNGTALNRPRMSE